MVKQQFAYSNNVGISGTVTPLPTAYVLYSRPPRSLPRGPVNTCNSTCITEFKLEISLKLVMRNQTQQRDPTSFTIIVSKDKTQTTADTIYPHSGWQDMQGRDVNGGTVGRNSRRQ